MYVNKRIQLTQCLIALYKIYVWVLSFLRICVRLLIRTSVSPLWLWMSVPVSGYVMTHRMCMYVSCHSLWISVEVFGYIVTDCRCIFPSLDPCFPLSLSLFEYLYECSAILSLLVREYIRVLIRVSLSFCLSLRYIVGNHTCIRTFLDSYFFLSLCLWIYVAVSGYFITHWCGDLNNRTAKEVPTSQSDNDVFARAAEKNTNVIFRGHCIEFIWESYWICVPLLDWIFWMEFVMATYRVVIHSCIILEIGWVIILLFSNYLFSLLFSMTVAFVLWKESSQTICHWNCI